MEKVKFSRARNRRDVMFIVTSPRSSVRARETESNGVALHSTHFHWCALRAAVCARAAALRHLSCPVPCCDLIRAYRIQIRKYFHDYEMFTNTVASILLTYFSLDYTLLSVNIFRFL